MTQSFIRYPGGKQKFKSEILAKLQLHPSLEYREPFFGGGSIGLEVLRTGIIGNFWFNDKDIGIYCLWKAVVEAPKDLKNCVCDFKPSIEAFDEFKSYFLDLVDTPIAMKDIVLCGLRKLALHQMSFSGLGVKSGGPLGGRNQNEKTPYTIYCRWNPENICKKINRLQREMSLWNIKITNLDYSNMILNDDIPAILYLDPPYYIKGNELYHHSFTIEDHKNLAKLLQNSKHKWALSYDNCAEIQELYNWANIEFINAKYSIAKSTNKEEVIITPRL